MATAAAVNTRMQNSHLIQRKTLAAVSQTKGKRLFELSILCVTFFCKTDSIH